MESASSSKRQQNQAYQGILVAVLAFATVGLTFGGSVPPCTPSTCTGPVEVSFPYANCSGEPTFYQINVQFGVCSDGYINEMGEHGLSQYEVVSDRVTCDRTASNASYEMTFSKWGACQVNIRRAIKGRAHFNQVAAMAESFLVLANVNDSYVSPQDFDNQPLPAYVNDFERCYSPDNCTDDGQAAIVYQTSYDQYGTCVDAYRSDYTPRSMIGECLNFYNYTYYKAGCFDQKGYFSAYFTDAACTKPSSITAVRHTCTGSYTELHCNAPITPIPFTNPEPSAPSSASSFQVSALLVLATLILGITSL
jgi:hypothetical protein